MRREEIFVLVIVIIIYVVMFRLYEYDNEVTACLAVDVL